MFGLLIGLAVLTCLYALTALVKPFWLIKSRKQALGMVAASVVSLPIIGVAGALSSAMTPSQSPSVVTAPTPAQVPLPERPTSVTEADWEERISICNLAGFTAATCVNNKVVLGEARKSVEAAEAKAEAETREAARHRTEEDRAKRDTKDMMWIEITKDAVRNSLRDPASAKFQNVKVYRPIPGQDTPVVCGEVNSKNAFGGMSGFQGFIASGDGSAIPPVLEEGFSEREYAKSREQLCRNVN